MHRIRTQSLGSGFPLSGAKRRAAPACALAALVISATVMVTAAPPASARGGSEAAMRPRRVVIVSVPTLTWKDLESGDAPALRKFADSAAIAAMATRSDRQPAMLGSAYVTIGAGTRAAGDNATDGEGLATTELFGNDTAGVVFRQRTGGAPGRGLVDLGIARIQSANDKLLYDGQPGALGSALAAAGYARSVIANGDGSAPDTPNPNGALLFRSAVGALMDRAGRVPAGKVDGGLLRSDRAAPYGVRLDPSAVERAVVATAKPRSVTLVEASDLVRVDRFDVNASPAGKAILHSRALRQSDALFARLLEHVDLTRDAVLVLGPAPASGDRSLTVAALHTPGTKAGLLRSATTRRAGFVTLADVGPTVLDVLGINRPDSMEGRPMRFEGAHGSADDRRAMLERANAAGLLRDSLVTPVTAAVLWTALVLAAATLLVLVPGRRVLERASWIPAALRWVALALIGFVFATMPVVALRLTEHGGKSAYWLFLSVFALVFAAVCQLLGRRTAVDPLLWALAALVALLVVDQFSGAHLEFNSVFGYSATVGIRFSGIGNGSFSLLAPAAVLVASLAAWRIPPPHGRRIAYTVLAVSFVALLPPLFGQDFGGTVAAAPAFALLAWLLAGRRVTFAAVAGLLGILMAAGMAAGFLDLLRPPDQRTHIGRFFEKVGNEGFSGFSTVIERKSAENLATFSTPLYLTVIIVIVAIGLALWFWTPRALATAVADVHTLRAAGISLGVLVPLSYGLNDSGLSIPALMLALIAATAAYVVAAKVDSPRLVMRRHGEAAPVT